MASSCLSHLFIFGRTLRRIRCPVFTDFVDSLLSGTFDFVLCIHSGHLSHVDEDVPSAELSVLYITFDKIESTFSVVGEVLRTMCTCFAHRQASASESLESSTHQELPRRTLRTFMGKKR